MPVQDTSIEHYHNMDLAPQQQKVLEAWAGMGEACIRDVTEWLGEGWHPGTVSARKSELQEMGYLEGVGERPSKKTGVKSNHYRVPLMIIGQGTNRKTFTPKQEASGQSHLNPTKQPCLGVS